MNKDKFQDKYDEVFQDLKEEKMNWDFEDFLKKAEVNETEGKNNDATPIIPMDAKSKPSFPKWFWMAASVVLLLSIGFIFNYNKESDITEQALLVENQIKQQKNDFIEEYNEPQEQIVVNHVSDSIKGTKKDSIVQDNSVAEKDVLDEILSKKGRMKKERKPKYVSNSSSKNNTSKGVSTDYEDSYVIVNGKKITNEKEAIDVATYSFMKMGNEFKKTVASSQKNESFNNEY
ncbi:hypothetical protein [Chryseobacterium oryctis]|uniref:Anti-sigma factor n=1 Tax=Chryseobacterium oryctis TaxID=2952618 RepID=A0ABT3HKS0_9FLAO|nr:hypothetical protein [Chryseobacterium oryctis]MCW3160354.1 hypothetical protein [Chryseobacterium oryctis]